MTLISTCSGVTLEIENCANAQGVTPNSTTKSNKVLNRLMSVWFEPLRKVNNITHLPQKICRSFMCEVYGLDTPFDYTKNGWKIDLPRAWWCCVDRMINVCVES